MTDFQKMSRIGVPIKVLHEAVGHVVTIELKNGEVYRGTLQTAEDNMNSQLLNTVFTSRDGQVSHLEAIYIRGSKVRFFVLPEMLRNAPMFTAKPGLRGKTAILRAQGPTILTSLSIRLLVIPLYYDSISFCRSCPFSRWLLILRFPLL